MNQSKLNNCKIEVARDCWGSYSFFGYKSGRCITEAHDMLEDLVNSHPDFNEAAAVFLKSEVQTMCNLILEATKELLHLLLEAQEPEVPALIVNKAIVAMVDDHTKRGLGFWASWYADKVDHAAQYVLEAIKDFNEEIEEL